jgi:penicillin-binding protein 1A
VNNDKNFDSISTAKFPYLSRERQGQLDCDLYELSDKLIAEIEQSIIKRDSTILADTSVAAPPETFLMTIYKRKLKIKAAQEKRDSLANALEILEGG